MNFLYFLSQLKKVNLTTFIRRYLDLIFFISSMILLPFEHCLAKKTQKGAVFVIFGCGASDLRDGQREFNETFTQCVIDTRDDARLYGK